MGSAKRKITYKCPFCNNRYYRDNLPSHLQDIHEELIPEDFTALRYTFNYVNKKPLDYHGKCTECGGPTPWDENKGRYDRQCEKKACKDSYLKKFEENMMRTKGVTRISATAAGQEKMLAHRRISGEYTFADGTKKTYTGKYEKAALEFMDKILHIKSKDIMCPGVILEYQFEGKTHIYITDFYYQPYNLIIEVKDGGDNPNKRSMPSYRAKQIAKEKFIVEHTNFNYIRLTNNELSQLISVFLDLKFQLIENTGDRVIHINEMMNALMGSSPVGYNAPPAPSRAGRTVPARPARSGSASGAGCAAARPRRPSVSDTAPRNTAPWACTYNRAGSGARAYAPRSVSGCGSSHQAPPSGRTPAASAFPV
jgi:very-short-patch-repair endonuclease